MLEGINKTKAVKIPGELYNIATGNIIADADYVVDRSYNVSQHTINQLVLDNMQMKYRLNVIKTPSNNSYTITVQVSVENQDSELESTTLESLTDKFIGFEFLESNGCRQGLKNDISYN